MKKTQLIVKKVAAKFGMYFSKQPAKYDLLKEEIKKNLLAESGGVLHVGAHYGQEAKLYSALGLGVIWIEADEKPFLVLQKTIKKYANQSAIQALVGDRDEKSVLFYEANNNTSSSLFEFGQDMPVESLKMVKTKKLNMVRIDKMFTENELKPYLYWCLDVQGAELLALKGAGTLISVPKVIEVEVSTREEYRGGALYSELHEYLTTFNFFPLWKPKSDSHENVLYVSKNHWT